MDEAFAGFEPGALRLLADLRRHNDRAWFAPRKERFERELFGPLRALVTDATEALRRAKIPLGGDPKRSVFRIYRDVRFGHDKSPFKTHLAAYLSYDGNRDTPGGLYVHVEPGRSRISAAFYRVEKPALLRWHAAIVDRPAAFRAVVRALAKRGVPLMGPDAWEDSYARVPRAYVDRAPVDLAPYLRLRSFVAGRDIADDELASPAAVAAIVRLAKDARPLLDFGWALI